MERVDRSIWVFSCFLALTVASSCGVVDNRHCTEAMWQDTWAGWDTVCVRWECKDGYYESASGRCVPSGADYDEYDDAYYYDDDGDVETPAASAANADSRGRLGVYIESFDEDTAALLGLGEPKGALVAGVEPGGPADRAGIQRRDVIVEFDGQTVDEKNWLPQLVAARPAGKTVELKVMRRGREVSFSVVLGSADD